MSTSNGSATNLAHNEKRSIRAFLLLFFTMVVTIMALVAYFYYESEKNLMLSQYRLELQLQSESFIPLLRNLHINFDKDQSYPHSEGFNTGIYDFDKKRIFSKLHTTHIDLNRVISLNEGYIQFVTQPESYYLGAKYVVLELKDDQEWLKNAYKNILLYGSVAFISFLLIGYILAKLFLRPMRQAVELLDNFIKDTTHELNTPIAAVLANIESLDISRLDEKSAKKINRIEIAARTISTIYDDLSYLTLNHNVMIKNEELDLKAIILERIEYFSLAMKQKKITLESDLSPMIVTIDKTKITRVIDNLLSNAIKYNKNGGTITLTLKENRFTVHDSGKGIAPNNLKTIFNRYVRADKVVGGFGLGLHIVSIITQEYGIRIAIDSILDVGTTITLNWSQDEKNSN